RRISRFSLTPTFLGNTIMSRFRSFRRDSRSLVRAQFLEHLSSATSAKRAVRPRLLFVRSHGAYYPTVRRTGLHAPDLSGSRPQHLSTTRFMRGSFCISKKRRTPHV